MSNDSSASKAAFDELNAAKREDDFLLTEGFDLLADFRAISSKKVRDQVRALVKVIADEQLAFD